MKPCEDLAGIFVIFSIGIIAHFSYCENLVTFAHQNKIFQ